MKEKTVTVNLEAPSLYAEPNTKLYRLKRKATYRDILRHIRRAMRGNIRAKILEIGTGSGFLTEIIEELYPDAELHGLEYDPRLVELTKSKVKKATIVQGNAESFSIGEDFDVVVSSQVIEHLFHPEAMMDCVHRHLKPGGVFIMTTPNLGGVGARIMKTKWHGYRDDHVALKSYKQWVECGEAHGFERIYAGSTLFSGIPIMNKLPLGLLNWALLLAFGSIKWRYGESFVGVFRKTTS